MPYPTKAERWCVWQYEAKGPENGNPFSEQWIKCELAHKCERRTADGFYDGDGRYIVRFMPSFEGEYTFTIKSSFAPDERGGFIAQAAREGNHGPVRVANTCHFAYEDGTPYYSIGATCYVWTQQSDDMIADTLQTLKNSAFNKIRFCVFPKHYDYNLGEPRTYPYEGTPMDSSVLTKENFGSYAGKSNGSVWDFERPNPEHYRHIEKQIAALGELGVEADIILFHPYDRWGFSLMSREQDEFYLRYVIARFAAYRNVWWSLANEYDILVNKSIADWEHIASVICERDPYGRLRSIHNCGAFYDHSRPWITHCSIQRQDLYKSAELTAELRERYKKPVVLDEIAYEGNIQHGWGNITAEELVRRFWECAVRGGYAGHGETIFNDTGKLWWSHGGRLYGESAPRFRFLLDVLKETPCLGLKPHSRCYDEVCGVPDSKALSGQPVKCYYLMYYSFMRPSFREYYFDDDTRFEVTVLDTWGMTREKRGIKSGRFRVDLPARQYMAVQLRKV